MNLLSRTIVTLGIGLASCAAGRPAAAAAPAWRVLDAIVSPLSIGSGEVKSLDAGAKVFVSSEDHVWVVVQFKETVDAGVLRKMVITDAAGKPVGTRQAYVNGSNFRRAGKSSELNPIFSMLKNEAAVQMLRDILDGAVVRDGNEALLVFVGDFASLEGLNLADADGASLPLKKASPAPAGEQPRPARPAEQPRPVLPAADPPRTARIQTRPVAPAPVKPPIVPDTPDTRESEAAKKLELARLLIRADRADAARERLQDIVKSYPGTRAAAEAERLLGPKQ